MIFKHLMSATAWIAPMGLLFLVTVLLPNEILSVRDHLAKWIPTAMVASLIIVRWNRQFVSPHRWAWFALTLATSLAGFGFGFKDASLLSLGWCVYCFTWAKSHFEKPSKQTDTNYSMMSYLPAVIILLGLPQFVWLQLDQLQWKGLSTYAWAVVQHLEVPFLIADASVEFPDITWQREAIFGGLFSLHTHLALSLLWLGIMRRPASLSPLYAAAAILWSFLTNFIRFCFSAWLTTQMGVDSYQGWQFYATGIVALMSSLFLFITTDKIIWVLLYPIAPKDSSELSTNPLLHLWNNYVSVVSNHTAGRPQE